MNYCSPKCRYFIAGLSEKGIVCQFHYDVGVEEFQETAALSCSALKDNKSSSFSYKSLP